MNPRRLYRSPDRQLAGVAGGMAEYLDIDPTIVRILWILAAIVSGGLALLVYLVLALVVPQSPYAATSYAPAGPAAGAPAGWTTATSGGPGWSPQAAAPAWGPDWNATTAAAQAPRRAESRGAGAAMVVGVVLVVLGVIALADAVLPAWSAAAIMGPAVILALGAALLVASVRRPAGNAEAPTAPAAAATDPVAAPVADPAVADPAATSPVVDPALETETGGRPA